jgi:hypothetical protein
MGGRRGASEHRFSDRFGYRASFFYVPPEEVPTSVPVRSLPWAMSLPPIRPLRN